MSSEPIKLSAPTSLEDTPSTGTYHQSCETLRYARFVDIMCGKPKQLLVIEGEVEEDLLQEAWENILQEYSQLIRTEKSNNVFDAYRKMIGAKWKMEFMEMALGLMRAQYERFEDDPEHRHNATLAEQIMLHGYNLIEDSEPEAYYRQLAGVEMECKSLVVFFNQYKAEYEAVAPKGEKVAEERDRMSYEKELNLLSQSQGYLIDPEAISAHKYASYVNYFLENQRKENRHG